MEKSAGSFQANEHLTMPSIFISANTSWNLVHYRSGLINRLLKAGYVVHVLSPTDDYTDVLVARGCIHHDVDFRRRFGGFLHEISTAFRVSRLRRLYQPACVFSFTAKSNIACGIFHAGEGIFAPNISGLGELLSPVGRIKKKYNFILQMGLRRAKVLFVQNQRDAELLRKLSLLRRIPVVILPGSGIDLTGVPIRSQNATKSALEGRFVMISRLHVKKGVREYFEAAKIVREEFPKAEFLLAGFTTEDSQEWVPLSEVRQAERSGLIRFFGRVESPYDLLSKVDCFVLPSYYNEGTPRSLIEAGAMGIPAITTKTPGCQDIIHHNHNGLLCEPASVSSLAAAMKQVLALDASSHKLMSRAALTRVRSEYSEEIVIKRYLNLVDSLS